jgi:hypothetical protein
LLFILELAEIHDLADRRIGVGRNLDKIKPGLFSQIKGACRGNDPDIFAFCSDQSDFGGPDAVIYAGAGVARRGRVVRSAGYGFVPLLLYSTGLQGKHAPVLIQAANRQVCAKATIFPLANDPVGGHIAG